LSCDETIIGISNAELLLAEPGASIPLPVASAARVRDRRLLSLLVLGIMLALCAPLFLNRVADHPVSARHGVLSFAGWGVLTRPVALDGQWRLTWLDRPEAGEPHAAFTDVPGLLQRKPASGGRPSALGTARLELTILGLAPGRYILHVPATYAANRVFIDDRPMGSRGQLGSSAATTRYDLRPQDILFDADGSALRLRIDLAAFLHRESGLGDRPVLGLVEPMQGWTSLRLMQDILFLTALFLLSINGLVSYLFRRKDRASLYLALAALFLVPASAIVGQYNLLLVALPGIGFTTMLALQYLGSTSALAAFLAYASTLYPRESPSRVVRLIGLALVGYFAAVSVALIASGTLAASQVALAWPAISGVTLLTIVIIVLRAALARRDGALTFLVGISIFFLFTMSAVFAWAGLFPGGAFLGPSALPLGTLMLLFSHYVVGAERSSAAIVGAEQLNEDLRELLDVNAAITSEMQLDALLARIVEATSHMLDAERSSLFLHDPRTGELWSLVAEGIEAREIRLPADAGIAGHAFTHSMLVNVADAYADPRFNGAIDRTTGFRTRSVLAIPILARDGRRLGVMQALNRRDGRPFGGHDEQRLAAFAAQAAIALDNATLFSEVVTSRNYNESILRSMSTGVVTLGRDDEVAKVNDAARGILAVSADGIEGANARALLAGSNPWLLAEIDAVDTTGDSRLLLDVDMVIFDGTSISANITIVPLLGEDAPTGLLLLIDDISVGKRMQSAMRRFLTQKVVEQVLERGDELMFGTACDASILFADIRNFTAMAETLTPRATVDMLNEVFAEFFEAVAAADGVIDKFIGDAVMAVYGAPISTGRDAANAVASAIGMIRALRAINRRRADDGRIALGLGVGIASGAVISGTIGSPKRMDYTVIGDSVNLSARLQDLTKRYGVEILICETTALALEGGHSLREIDLITVRGRTLPTRIFEVRLPEDDDGDGFAALRAAYERGRAGLAARDWDGAVDAFAAALACDPADRPAQIMLERARSLAETPPPSDWNGVFGATT
jgi:adenylate cyclase